MTKGRKRHPDLRDWHLWAEVTRSLTPLRRVRRPSPAKAPDVEPAKPTPAPAANALRGGGPSLPAWSPAALPSLAVAQKSMPKGRIIEPRLKRRLIRGQMPLDAVLDLHGMRQNEARAALHRFITARAARGDRTVLVITGKGLGKAGNGGVERSGVLRTMLPVWLSEPGMSPLIAGWDNSAPAHGGDGAFYVRLRRTRP